MRIPRVPLCQCRNCMKTPLKGKERHRRYYGRYKEVQKRNKKIRYQKPDLVKMSKDEINNWEITIPRTGRYTD